MTETMKLEPGMLVCHKTAPHVPWCVVEVHPMEWRDYTGFCDRVTVRRVDQTKQPVHVIYYPAGLFDPTDPNSRPCKDVATELAVAIQDGAVLTFPEFRRICDGELPYWRVESVTPKCVEESEFMSHELSIYTPETNQ